MLKKLKKNKSRIWYFVDGKRIDGISPNLYGDISGLYGDISDLYGNISDLYGNISSGLYGDISGLYGNISGLYGDIDDCNLTNEEREKGVDIEELIERS